MALALHTARGLAVGLLLLVGYLMAAGFLIVAAVKPIVPNNVGVRWMNGEFRGAGWELSIPPGTVVTHGWWLMGVCAVLGVATLWLTHRGARRYLRLVSERRELRLGQDV